MLCTRDGEVLGVLPSFEAEVPWWQEVQCLVSAVRRNHGLDVTVLRLLSTSRPSMPGGDVTYLAELEGQLPASVTLEPWSGELTADPLRLPYAEPGGPARDLAWAVDALQQKGLRPAGAPRQIRTWNLSSLWRIPLASGGSAWLKCVPPFFAHEGDMVELLRGARVPQLLAHQDNRVLLAEIPGSDQYDATGPVLRALVDLLLGLQVEWAGRIDELVKLGLPDWRAETFTGAVAALLERNASELPSSSARTLTRFVDRLPQRFAELASCRIPDSLVHGDFAPGNARWDGENLTLLDWGDCGIGHPLLDQAAFLDRIPADEVAALRTHWSGRWRSAIPGCDPDRAARLVAPIAAVRQALIYQGFLDQIEQSERVYHRADPSEWLNRTAALV